MKRWMYFGVIVVVYFIVMDFGVRILERFVDPSIAEWFPFILMIVIWIGGFFLSRKSSSNIVREILPPSTPIPEDLQRFHDELLSLGFKLVGEMKLKYFFKKQNQWVYFNEDQSIVAYTHNYTWARIWFSSYFEDGFDVTTYHEHGEDSESKKFARRVVKTGVSAALDFHMHHSNQHKAQHGHLMQFTDLKQHVDWTVQQQYEKEESKDYIKQIGRVILSLLVMLILTVIISIPVLIIYALTFGLEADNPPMFLIWPIVIISGILSYLWAMRPVFWPKTVESRKKHKKEEVEVASEEIYPF